MRHVAAPAAAAAVAAATAGKVLSFTPTSNLVGGLLLGIAVAGKLIANGRILGISGTFKGFVNHDAQPWRFAFLAGICLGAALLNAYMPGAFEALPPGFPVARTALSGLLVGLGTSMGNGCTSGHGICGNARASRRSLAFTCVFMAAGAATATLARSAEAIRIVPLAVKYQGMLPWEARTAAAFIAAGCAAWAALAAVSRLCATAANAPPPLPHAAGKLSGGLVSASPGFCLRWELASEVLAGTMFALGLGVAGMTHPSKVVGFLSVTSPAWDPSLPFIMASAIGVAAAAFYAVQRLKFPPKPLFRHAFSIPTTTTIDSRLLLGGALFGAGWGLTGLCPGPALVNLAHFWSAQWGTYFAAMVLGMYLDSQLLHGRWPPPKLEAKPPADH